MSLMVLLSCLICWEVMGKGQEGPARHVCTR
jgi:hypothetical protein